MSEIFKPNATRLKIAFGIALPLSIFVHNPITDVIDVFLRKPLANALSNTVLAGLIFIAMWHFQPWTRSRLRWPKLGLKWIVVAAIFAYQLIPVFKSGLIPTQSINALASALAVSLGVGLIEESFSRGIIFGAVESKSIWLSSAISSFTFGLFHLTNLKNDYSLSYTVLQSIHAAGMGFLFAGLMMFSGSIWIPILLHALYDFPLITIPDLGKGSFPISSSELAWTVREGILLSSIGLLLIYLGTSKLIFFTRQLSASN